MAMKAMYNAGAQLSLGELNKNINKAGKALARVSSGMRIIGAQDDDSASFAISEKMREQIRSLLQDNQNVQNGSSMIKVAERGIDQIIQLLDHMNRLAIDAANDSNTDEDRRTIQKEFDRRAATINDIAVGTEYNGKRLLDGTWARKKVANISQTDPETLGPGGTSDDGGIKSDGVFVLKKGVNNVTIPVADGVKNVKIVQEDPTETLHGIYIVGPSNGGANIWIENLNIENQADGSIIKFSGTDNFLTVKGKNTINYGNNNDYNKAVINVGDGLTLEGDGSLSIRNTGGMTCSGIGVDQDYFNPSTNITINGGTYDIWINDDGAAIGASVNSRIGDIIINGGNISVRSVSGAGIGSTGGPVGLYDYDKGDANSKAGNIIVGKNATINALSYWGAGIGTGTGKSFVQSIKLHVDANIIANSLHGENIGRGVTGVLGNKVEYFDDGDDMSAYGLTTTSELYDGNPLWIQHGTQSGQRIHVYINSMRTEALKGTIPNETDKAQIAALDYDSAKQAELQAILNAAKNMTLDDAKVTTVDNAKIAIRVVEGALEYALNEATTQGAYLQRLEFTDSNVTIMGENVTQAESTIRDADMAREMAEYTKYNILTQSSQAMLAQANQNQSSILNLLQ